MPCPAQLTDHVRGRPGTGHLGQLRLPHQVVDDELFRGHRTQDHEDGRNVGQSNQSKNATGDTRRGDPASSYEVQVSCHWFTHTHTHTHGHVTRMEDICTYPHCRTHTYTHSWESCFFLTNTITHILCSNSAPGLHQFGLEVLFIDPHIRKALSGPSRALSFEKDRTSSYSRSPSPARRGPPCE